MKLFLSQSIVLSSLYKKSTMQLFILLCIHFISTHCISIRNNQLGNQ